MIDYEPLDYLTSKGTLEYEVSCPFYDYRTSVFSFSLEQRNLIKLNHVDINLLWN